VLCRYHKEWAAIHQSCNNLSLLVCLLDLTCALFYFLIGPAVCGPMTVARMLTPCSLCAMGPVWSRVHAWLHQCPSQLFTHVLPRGLHQTTHSCTLISHGSAWQQRPRINVSNVAYWVRGLRQSFARHTLLAMPHSTCQEPVGGPHAHALPPLPMLVACHQLSGSCGGLLVDVVGPLSLHDNKP
jgi:hypothetical protein